MRNITLFADGPHKFILLNETEGGEEEGIHSNQYLITDGECAVLMDPGGFGVMPRVLSELLRHTTPKNIKAIILSHQDPDIVGGLTAWLEITDCPAYLSRIWLRFLPHYGIGGMSRFVGVPDAGMPLEYCTCRKPGKQQWCCQSRSNIGARSVSMQHTRCSPSSRGGAFPAMETGSAQRST